MTKKLSVALMCLCIVSVASNAAKAEGETVAIQKGSKVALQYTLTVDGEEIDRSSEGEPLRYTQGQGELIPGLEKQLEGLHSGDAKAVKVAPEEAYGPVNPEAFQEVDKTLLPEGVELQAGTPLRVSSPDGRSRMVKVAEVKDTKVVVDFNHPLAGKTLDFAIKVISVQ